MNGLAVGLTSVDRCDRVYRHAQYLRTIQHNNKLAYPQLAAGQQSAGYRRPSLVGQLWSEIRAIANFQM